MKFGVCMGLGYVPPSQRAEARADAPFRERVDWLLEGVRYLKRTGFDYVEFPVSMLAGAQEEYEILRDALKRADLKPEAFNCFIPGDIRLTGPDVNMDVVRDYLEKVIPRASQCGGKVIVFGSGAARKVPEGFPMERAQEQIVEFLRLAGGIAFGNRINIAIEPLNRRETNIINSVDEAVALAERVDILSVGVLADLYHMEEEHEDFESVVDAGSFLLHVHVADTGRKHPGSGSYDYESFFSALKAIYYSGRVSIECALEDFEKDTADSLRFLKKAWTSAPAPEEG